jgi:leishmanolysin
VKPDCKEKIICPSNCSGNGICLDEKECLCLAGFTGATCDFPICPRGCSGQGKCVGAGFCQCRTGWTGLTCTEPSCEGNDYCSG